MKPILAKPGLFRDRREAGRLLAEKLTAYANRPDVLIGVTARRRARRLRGGAQARRVAGCRCRPQARRRHGNPEIAARFARGPEFGVIFC